MRFSEILLSNCNATFACIWATSLTLLEQQHEAYQQWEQQQSPICRSRIREMCVWEFSIPVTMFYTHSAFATILNFSLHYKVEQEKRQRTSAPLARRNRTKVRARVFRTNQFRKFWMKIGRTLWSWMCCAHRSKEAAILPISSMLRSLGSPSHDHWALLCTYNLVSTNVDSTSLWVIRREASGA